MPSSERPQRIALVGFMGSGKTTVGRALARLLGYPFIDLDAAIESAAGKRISALFAEEGEGGFRARETEALQSLGRRSGSVVLACGGGVAASETNRRLLAAEFVAVWLDVPFGELMDRLSAEPERAARPLLSSERYREEAEALFRAREPLYREAGRLTYRWKADESPEDAASAIAAMLAAAEES